MTAQELRDDFSRTSLQQGSAMVADRIRRRAYACARCGRHASAERMIYSRWTGYRYCTDFKACNKRAERRASIGPMAVAQ